MATPVAVRRGAVAVFLVILAFQIGVPASQFTRPRPSRFGWQMFAGIRLEPRFWVVFANGEAREVYLPEVLVRVRGDQTDHEKLIVPHLFRLYPDATHVRFQPGGASDYREYTRDCPGPA